MSLTHSSMFIEGIAIKFFPLDGLHRPRVTFFSRFSSRGGGLYPLGSAWYSLTFLSVGNNVPKEQSLKLTTSVRYSAHFKLVETLQANRVITTLPTAPIS